jgi:protein-S-isoprenylcysteine O-methyltransferase Ste14
VLYAVAVAGAAWWVAVAVSDDVRRWTLGGWPAAWLAGPDLVLFVAASAVAGRRRSWRWAAVAAAWSCAVTAVLVVGGLWTGRAGWGCVAMVPAAVLLVGAAVTLRHGGFPTSWFFRGPFRFVVADDRTPTRHVLASLGQLVVFWTTFFVLVPAVLVSAEHRLAIDAPWLDRPLFGWLGAALLAAGSVVGLWSCVTMASVGHGTPLPAATARALVIRGPYRYVRNPMAVAGAAQTVGVGLIVGAWTVVVVAVVGAAVWDAFIRPEEEADLSRRFGAPYDTYRTVVRCWIPRLATT